jgi:hypothetical protein
MLRGESADWPIWSCKASNDMGVISMWGRGKQEGHRHNYVSHWAGPGLVRMVCDDCSHVSIKVGDEPSRLVGQDSLAVDSLSWLIAQSA